MHDQDFQVQVLTSLKELQTKMNILVGEDGTGGWKRDTDFRLRAAERHRWRQTGGASILGAVVAFVTQFLFGWWKH